MPGPLQVIAVRFGAGADFEGPADATGDGFTGIDNLFAFARVAGVKVIYTLRLLSPSAPSPAPFCASMPHTSSTRSKSLSLRPSSQSRTSGSSSKPYKARFLSLTSVTLLINRRQSARPAAIGGGCQGRLIRSCRSSVQLFTS